MHTGLSYEKSKREEFERLYDNYMEEIFNGSSNQTDTVPEDDAPLRKQVKRVP